MNKRTQLRAILTGTALTVAASAPAFAQTLNVDISQLEGKSAECRALGQFIADQDGSIAGAEPARVAEAVNNDVAAECAEIQNLLAARAGTAAGTAQTETDTEATESDVTTESVETSQEATIVGEAVVRVPEPNIDVRVPRPEVTVRKAPPQVTVQDGAARIWPAPIKWSGFSLSA